MSCGSRAAVGFRKVEGREAERLLKEKDARIKAFDSEPVILERKGKHRLEWLAARGR